MQFFHILQSRCIASVCVRRNPVFTNLPEDPVGFVLELIQKFRDSQRQCLGLAMKRGAEDECQTPGF
jgi:hypothetical protein